MSEQKLKTRETYIFSVEGQTEKWYLDWLGRRINEAAESACSIKINSMVRQSPLKFAKIVAARSVHPVIHICDYESNDEAHIKKFERIIDQIKEVNNSTDYSFQYNLGYSNFTFELWMILHKIDCNGVFADRTQYLSLINKAYNASFESLDNYKKEDNFKQCLNQLTLDNVKSAVRRSKQIMKNNERNAAPTKTYKGFCYYTNNPALTVGERIEEILKYCGLM